MKYKTEIGEGILLIRDGVYQKLVNLETKKERVLSSNEGILLVDDSEIDFNAIWQTFGKGKGQDKSLRYGLNRYNDFKNGICAFVWTIYPDGMWFADSDGYGIQDNNEEKVYCIMNRDFKILMPFRPVKDIRKILDGFPESLALLKQEKDNEKGTELFCSNKSITRASSTYIKDDIDPAKNAAIKNNRIEQIKIDSINYNFSAVSIGTSFTILNTRRGVVKMITRRNGPCLIPDEIGWNNIKGISHGTTHHIEAETLECVYFSTKGILVIKAIAVSCEDIMLDFQDPYIYGEPTYEHYEWNDEVYCFLNQDLDVVVPFRTMHNPKLMAEKYPDIEWDENDNGLTMQSDIIVDNPILISNEENTALLSDDDVFEIIDSKDS